MTHHQRYTERSKNIPFLTLIFQYYRILVYDYAFPDQAVFKIKFTSIYEDYWEIIETSYFISLLPTEFFIKTCRHFNHAPYSMESTNYDRVIFESYIYCPRQLLGRCVNGIEKKLKHNKMQTQCVCRGNFLIFQSIIFYECPFFAHRHLGHIHPPSLSIKDIFKSRAY